MLPVRGSKESAKPVASNTAPSDSARKAIILAIEDEIYDEGCQGYGFDAAIAHDGKSYEMPVYFEPTDGAKKESEGAEGSIIYRLLPIGEIQREYSIDHSGLATLYGHPEWNFPPTTSSLRTVFMDDDTLCQLKHDSVRARFTLDLSAVPERLRAAAARQRQRMGERYRAHKRDCSFSWR